MPQLETMPVMSAPRADGRSPAKLRPIRFQNHIAPNATGSTLVQWGNTHVICGVTVEDSVPRWMKEQAVAGGWITAEYSMLPYSTQQRKQRDITKGKIDGRSQEIQRLIGRAMRAAREFSSCSRRNKRHWRIDPSGALEIFGHDSAGCRRRAERVVGKDF